jgi:hypothetical protein
MPGGMPHWVLGTSNSICVGRHFYAKSTIRSSVVANVHSFLLGGALTNQELPETRTLLYQLMVFWSMKIRDGKTDVDGGSDVETLRSISNFPTLLGAHIPDLSSEVEFFDVLYLGIFVILSSAFDGRFYNGQKPSIHLLKEMACAIDHFYSLLSFFSEQFIVVLGGQPVSHFYVLNRMLGEFAAASAVLATAIHKLDAKELGNDVQYRIVSSACAGYIEAILEKSHPEVLPYYLRRLASGHKDFLWTGPNVKIIPRSDDFAALVPASRKGEFWDLPSHQIYTEDLDPNPPITPDSETQAGKRLGGSLNLEDERAKKRSRQS